MIALFINILSQDLLEEDINSIVKWASLWQIKFKFKWP